MKLQERNMGQAARLLVAISASAFLAACGGGGGGNNNTAPAAPASAPGIVSGIVPQTSVPAPTYAANSFQLAAFNEVNNYRNAMGVGMLKQDPNLDTAAQAHALYLFSNLKSGAITSLVHTEVAGNVNYYGDTPVLRAQKAGVPTTEFVGENVAAGQPQASDSAAAADCIGQALASVYHLADLTSTQESIGLGYTLGDATYPIYTCDSEFGTSTGVNAAQATTGYSYQGGQQIPAGAVLSSPYPNETGVALAMRPEAPNPAPDFSAPGRPILVRVNAVSGNTLTVTQFTLTDNTGAPVAARILVPATAQTGSTTPTVADPNSLLPNGTAVLLPQVALKANTSYTVTFAGARDGVAVAKTLNFTTGAN